MHVNGCTAKRATLTGLFIVPCLQVQSSPNVGWQPSQEAAATVEVLKRAGWRALSIRLLSPYLSPWRSHGTHEPKVDLARNVSPLLSCTRHNTTVEPSRRELAWQLRTRGNGLCVRARAWPWSCEATASVPGEVVHHRNCMNFQLWFQNWWAVYVLNNVFTFQRRWPVLRTLALRKFLIELNPKLPALYSHPVGLIESIVNGKVQHLYGRSLQPNSTWAKCSRG